MRAWVAAGLWLWVSAAWPAGVYKCTGPDGRTIYAQTPCATNAQEMNIGRSPAAPVASSGSGLSDTDRALIERGVKAQSEVMRSALPETAKTLIDLHGDFERTVNVAGATARIALQGPVLRMQDIYSTTQRVAVAGCFGVVRAALLSRMRSDVDAYLAFMRKSEQETYQRLFDSQRLDMGFWIVMRDCVAPDS